MSRARCHPRSWSLLFVLFGAIGGAAGCTQTLKAATVQPNPMANQSDVLMESEHLYIRTKDMDLSHFVFVNSAYFVVKSPDRLRFHVRVVHKWQEVADITTWDVRLEDDSGHVYRPEAKERRDNEFETHMWDREQRSVTRNTFGDITKVHDDGWKRRMVFDSIDVFNGEGDYVFFAKNMFNPKTKRLTLIMSRPGLEYRYTWNFSDEPDDAPASAEEGEDRSASM